MAQHNIWSCIAIIKQYSVHIHPAPQSMWRDFQNLLRINPFRKTFEVAERTMQGLNNHDVEVLQKIT